MPRSPFRYWYVGSDCATAAAFAHAMDTPISALPPRRDLFGVPSSPSIFLSIADWPHTSMPRSAGKMMSRMFERAALICPSSSRSSFASPAPVDAPDGTAKVPSAVPPESLVCTVTAIVGRPRESRISSAVMFSIDIISSFLARDRGRKHLRPSDRS
ncbi:MAG: hypothetical protein UY74_C0061G0016 [Candidatus Kaiserbacteria bacterium GW2011_GWC2_52_8b]|uniref:Uncharacterized protein n=1 Tax=Candidatus Kaiserbacteria bacterium GW2011_GWC2_52_8b TaxID=1618676 RepID=A0A0G1XG01_9BACT|nr:MAG: hypothetical protein UY74_C0061G0016 [Candidatus Kaiserbacteria bacterium GW2011_GWC2_52_8b]